MPEPRRYITDTWGKRYVPAADAARYLGVSLQTVHEWAASGRLESERLSGHWLYVRWEDVVAAARDRQPAEQAEEVPS